MEYNNLSPQNFIAVIDKMDELVYHCQQIQIPTLDANGTTTPAAFNTLYEIGDVVEYGPLVINFVVDDSLANYLALQRWIIDNVNGTTKTPYKDISVILNNNNNNKIAEYAFEDCFPTSVSEIVLNTTDDSSYYLATATFRYTKFTIK